MGAVSVNGISNGDARRFSGEMPESRSWGNRMKSNYIGCDRRDAVKDMSGHEAAEENVMSIRSLRGVMILCVAALVLLALGVGAGAQTFRGTILGTVTDTSGA